MRESAKAAAPLSIFASGFSILCNLFKVSDMIASVAPYIAAFLPLIGIVLVSISLCWSVGMVLAWDKRKANEVIDILQEYVKEGTKQYHPAMRSFDFSLRRENTLRRIAEKHYKWLGLKGPDDSMALSWQGVQNADDSINVLRLYGFLRARRRINRKKVNKIP